MNDNNSDIPLMVRRCWNESQGLDGGSNSSVFERYSDMRFRQKFLNVAFQVEMVLAPLYFIIGLFGNGISLVIWSRKKIYRENSSAIYLAAIALADLCFLQPYLAQYFYRIWFINTKNYRFICPLHESFFLVCQYVPIGLTLTFTVDRWVAIYYPFKRQTWCTTRRAMVVSGCWFVGTALIVGGSNLLSWENGPNGCRVLPNQFTLINTAFEQTLWSAILPTCTLIFNILVIVELKHITQNSSHKLGGVSGGAGGVNVESCPNSTQTDEHLREQRAFRSSTIMLLMVSFYLIICTLPSGVFYFLQHVTKEPSDCMTDEAIFLSEDWANVFTVQYAKEIVDFISTSHYVGNFVIYLSTHSAYRSEFCQIMCSCCRPLRMSHSDQTFYSTLRHGEGNELLPNGRRRPPARRNRGLKPED